MIKIPEFNTAKRTGRISRSNIYTRARKAISTWVEEAEARAEERAASLPEQIKEECDAIDRKREEDSLKHQKKMAEKTYTTDEIKYLKSRKKKYLGWTDEQCDEHFASYTIKDKGISKEAQALNDSYALNGQLMEQVNQLKQELQEALAKLAKNK